LTTDVGGVKLFQNTGKKKLQINKTSYPRRLSSTPESVYFFFLIALFRKNNLSTVFRDHALIHEFNSEQTQPEHHCQPSITASVGRYQHPPELLYGGTRWYSWSRQHATSQRLQVQFPGLILLAAPWPWGLSSL